MRKSRRGGHGGPTARGSRSPVLPGRRAHLVVSAVLEETDRDRGTLATPRSPELAIVDELRIWGGERLLFVECGDGLVAEEAWRRIAKGYVCGLDRSARLVALATRLRGVPGKLEFKTWDGRCVPCPDGFFDAVVSWCDVRRWPKPVAVLRELRRVVRSDGQVYLVEANGGGGPAARPAAWPPLPEQAGPPLLPPGSRAPLGGTAHPPPGGAGACARA